MDCEIEVDIEVATDVRVEGGDDVTAGVESAPRLLVSATDVRKMIIPVDFDAQTTFVAGATSFVEEKILFVTQ